MSDTIDPRVEQTYALHTRLAKLEQARRAKYDEAAGKDAEIQAVLSAPARETVWHVRYATTDGQTKDEHWSGKWGELYPEFLALNNLPHIKATISMREVPDLRTTEALRAEQAKLYDEAADIEAQIQSARSRYTMEDVTADD